MIDIEHDVFNRIASRLRDKMENRVYVTGEYVKSPPEFPCVSILEVDNQVYRNGRDTGNVENYAQVAYEVNVYSNKNPGKKSECKKIIGLVDDEFENIGFTRTVYTTVPNELDATIYRIVTRYRAIIGKDGTIYRR